MKELAVVIPVYQRHDILAKCLESVRKCPEFRSGVAHLILAPDFGDNKNAVASVAARSGCGEWDILDTPPKRGYSDGNTLRARRAAFGLGYDLVLTLDSDTVVLPTFLGTMLATHQWCKKKRLSSIVQSSITCVGSPDYKAYLSGALIAGDFGTGTMHMMDREVFDLMDPYYSFFEAYFAGLPPVERDNPAIWDWLASFAYHDCAWFHERLAPARFKSCGLSHDAVTLFAALHEGIFPVHTVVNYAVNIGTVGENTTPEIHAAFRNVKLDSMPVPSSFRWWPSTDEALFK